MDWYTKDLVDQMEDELDLGVDLDEVEEVEVSMPKRREFEDTIISQMEQELRASDSKPMLACARYLKQ